MKEAPESFRNVTHHVSVFWQRETIFLQRPRIVNTTLKEKNHVGGMTLPDFKTYYKVTVIKTVRYWQKTRQIDQWDRIKGPDTDPHKYSQLIFDKGTKAILWNKHSFFIKWCWNNSESTCKKNESRHKP